jgi:hypothetical protein
VFQASEGGPVSVGRRKFQSKSDATPTPQNKFEAVPVGIPLYRTDRISRMGGMTPVSSPAPASITEVVLSRTSLAGICLIAFACGIVTTVMVDSARPRASEHDVAAREPEPAAPPAAPASEPVAPARVAAMPIAPTPAVHVQAAPAPNATTAAEPVVVQMPNLAETSGARTTVALRSWPPASSRAPARLRPAAAAAPAKAAAAGPPKAAVAGPAKAAAAGPAKAAAAPAKAAAAPTRKTKTPAPASRWIDPFSE